MADVFVVDETGEIAVRIKQAQFGVLPLPLTQFADKVTRHLRRSGIEVTWTELEGDPLALMKVPENKLSIGDQTIRIDSIACQDHQLEMIGSSIASKMVEEPNE